MTSDEPPSVEELGNELLDTAPLARVLFLVLPFALCGMFFIFAARGLWIAALACPVLLSFMTYGSISHDLVHRNLGLPPAINEVFLSLIELITFRSGHAYRATHLHHHAHVLARDDIEGAAAHMAWWRALLDGITLQPRLFIFAMRRAGRHRAWAVAEGIAVVAMLAACVAVVRITPIPLAYAALMIAGSWIFPFMTSYVPHVPNAATELTRTRLFRGRMLSWLALEHLYHLEHHLYPHVPHQHWPELARRLDPYFHQAGIKPIKLWF